MSDPAKGLRQSENEWDVNVSGFLKNLAGVPGAGNDKLISKKVKELSTKLTAAQHQAALDASVFGNDPCDSDAKKLYKELRVSVVAANKEIETLKQKFDGALALLKEDGTDSEKLETVDDALNSFSEIVDSKESSQEEVRKKNSTPEEEN